MENLDLRWDMRSDKLDGAIVYRKRGTVIKICGYHQWEFSILGNGAWHMFGTVDRSDLSHDEHAVEIFNILGL